MSATSTPNDSPVVQPLHNPANAAHVVVPQAPLGNVVNQVPGAGTGLGAKALLAKKMANQSAAYHSPTDNLMTPVTRKLSAAKKKHFSKGPAKSAQLFAQKEENSSETEEQDASPAEPAESDKMELDNDDENPF
ncbi:hypothetical protein BT96DRAFT_912646 [Gymnopus androsaceus JB14]|uniref:Uncharacterized protein n=1 Tax=Gymnopus androsaceus JB14 TaxID=1447944 RepID=A0A6A4ILN8_9AGAR|nr:hypothetical protein BT96DRAFT_912646 [Gymnopus androsaceus JB14]